MDWLKKETVPSILSDSSPQSPVAISREAGRAVSRSPKDLHLHPALEKIGWAGLVGELNEAAGPAGHPINDPILIAKDGTVLAGFGRWRMAVFEQISEIYCIEHSLAADDSLMFILAHHQTQRGWNAFVRIRLALTLKPSLQQAALDNMRCGGKYKGLANLPEARHLDVRQRVADVAGVCPRNVSNVETILETAHESLIDALAGGTLKINRAMQFCRLTKIKQLEAFILYSEGRAINQVIRRSLLRPQTETSSPDVGTVLSALQRRDEDRSGTVVVRIVRHKHTVVLVGQDLLAKIDLQKELLLKCVTPIR